MCIYNLKTELTAELWWLKSIKYKSIAIFLMLYLKKVVMAHFSFSRKAVLYKESNFLLHWNSMTLSPNKFSGPEKKLQRPSIH